MFTALKGHEIWVLPFEYQARDSVCIQRYGQKLRKSRWMAFDFIIEFWRCAVTLLPLNFQKIIRFFPHSIGGVMKLKWNWEFCRAQLPIATEREWKRAKTDPLISQEHKKNKSKNHFNGFRHSFRHDCGSGQNGQNSWISSCNTR